MLCRRTGSWRNPELGEYCSAEMFELESSQNPTVFPPWEYVNKRTYFEDAINATINEIPKDFVKIPGFSINFRFIDPLRTAIKDGAITDSDVRKLAALFRFMNACCVSWNPTCGSGSQNCVDYEYQKDFYKKMAEEAELLWRENQW